MLGGPSKKSSRRSASGAGAGAGGNAAGVKGWGAGCAVDEVIELVGVLVGTSWREFLIASARYASSYDTKKKYEQNSHMKTKLC